MAAVGDPTPDSGHDTVRSAAPVAGRELLRAGLDIAYQPIVHLGSGAIIAYEALARPRHASARNPLVFFAELERSGLRLIGERAALAAAVAHTDERFERIKLFLNASPSTLVDPDFDPLELVDLAEAHGLAPSDLVVEVTESEAVHDLDTLERRTRRLRRLGIGLAVDDAGAGHASFRVITHLRPSFIKIDRDLVAGVDVDGARHAFIDAMVRFSRQIGSRLIAEGIEHDGELASLAGLGVEAGQGYYIARPSSEEFAAPSPEARRRIAAAAQRLSLGAAKVTVADLVRPAVAVDPDVTIREAYAAFTHAPHVNVLVATREGRVTAQVTRTDLERRLAAPGAWSKLGDRAVTEVLDHHPMVAPADLDVVELGAVIAARPPQDLLADVVVTGPGGVLAGVVAVRDVVRNLAEQRRFGQRDLNPVSGLPGAASVDDELAHRLDAGEAVTVLLVDVDGLRHVNELGGYALGDETIRALARCFTGAVGRLEGGILGHVGGDDFIALIPPAAFEDLIAELVRTVERDVLPVLRTELRLHAADHLCDQLSLSMAGVDLVGSPPPGHRALEWAQERLTTPIRVAKDHAGHSCVHASDDLLRLSTWAARRGGWRRIAMGLADPRVVLAAVDRIDRGFAAWTDEDAPQGFPGPRSTVEALLTRHIEPLRARALAALAEGENAVEVVVEGEEGDVLGLLDRMSIITRCAHATAAVPLPPDLVLLGRLLSQRSRVITRHDRRSQRSGGDGRTASLAVEREP